jgi:N-acetylmuramoyl-L-alanine amidase
MLIVIDAGHGPNTPGKRTPDGSMKEYEFNSAVANYLRDELAKYENVRTHFTHSDREDVPLKRRTDEANRLGADLFVSIHANAVGADWSSAEGIETYVYKTRPREAVALAEKVQAQLIASTGRKNRGVKTADFHVLRETKMTAILVECGFMTHREEAALLKSDEYRRKVAAAIARAIAEQYGLKRKPESATPKEVTKLTTNQPKTAYELELEKAIAWAKKNGVSNCERLNEPATRAQVLLMLYRALGGGK